MKILFVGRAKKNGEVSPILITQGNSLVKEGCSVDYFAIKEAGISGYLKNIPQLKKYIQKVNPDIVHAHFSLTGFITSLSTKKPVVVSLMGSFPKKTWRYLMIQLFINFFWKAVIVKSEKTAKQLKRNKLHVIPNGVDLDFFSFKNKTEAKKIIGLTQNKKYVLFVADPNRKVKNFKLAKETVKLLNNPSVELKAVYNVPHKQIVLFMNACDVLILTSLSEGSPNVVKEAMASNLPIVSTDVGNVRELLQNLDGTFVSNTFEAFELAEMLKKALNYSTTNGNIQLKKLKLDSESVAKKIKSIYLNLLTNKA